MTSLHPKWGCLFSFPPQENRSKSQRGGVTCEVVAVPAPGTKLGAPHVCRPVFANMSPGKKAPQMEEWPPSYLVQLTVDAATPMQDGPGLYKKENPASHGEKPVSSVPLQTVLQFLPPGSCAIPASPSLGDGVKRTKSTLPSPSCFWSQRQRSNQHSMYPLTPSCTLI